MIEIGNEAGITEVIEPETISTVPNEQGKTDYLKSSPYIIPVAVLVLTFFTYAGTLNFNFVYDDVTQIVEGNHIKDWSYIPDYFANHSWFHRDSGAPGNYYRPTFLTWLLINYKLFGLNPWGWHFVTVLAHLVATLAVFLLAMRLTEDNLTAGFASLIFGLHPVHNEAVAWISGATETLMAILLIFSFLAYLNNRERRPKAGLWLAASLLLYSIALLDKETSITFVGIIFTYEWLFKKEPQTNYIQRILAAFIRTVPYLAVSALYLTMRMIALNGFSHIGKENNFPISVTLTTLPFVIWSYLKLLIFPVGLSAFYDTFMVKSPGLMNFYLPLIILVAIGAGLWLVSRQRPLVQFALIWLLLPMTPLFYLPLFGEGNLVHDRYLYVPSIGFSILVAMALRLLKPGKEKLLGLPAVPAAAMLVMACLLVPATTLQLHFWENDVKLHYRSVEAAPKSTTLRFNLADILYDNKMYREAKEQYEKIVEMMPQQYTSNSRLGSIALMSGELDKAEYYLRTAIQTGPGRGPFPHMLLGFVLKDTGRLDEAAQSLRLALRIDPTIRNAHYGLGLVLRKKGNLAEALEEFKAEFAINPDLPTLQDQIVQTEAALNQSSLNNTPLSQSSK